MGQGRGRNIVCIVVGASMLIALGASAQTGQPNGKQIPADRARYPIRVAPASQPPPPPPAPSAPEPERFGRTKAAGRKAEDIMKQPVRDVGLSKLEIPPVLIAAAADPYSLKGLTTCRLLAGAVNNLNAALGPDFASTTPAPPDNRAGKIAEAGGRMVVNSLIPFRGLVREVSGAAPAERRLAAAVDAGFARRGFLRGTQSARRCK